MYQRVEEFWGDRLWLSFQNARLVTAAPNPRKIVISASLVMSIIRYISHYGACAGLGVSEYLFLMSRLGDVLLHKGARFLLSYVEKD
ncbi:hypothetical protein WB44_06060 [Synechococcus sp. WH 8020]|nr:hypothetical protein WB44_06060 [Synechococcus sp. WH 8020]